MSRSDEMREKVVDVGGEARGDDEEEVEENDERDMVFLIASLSFSLSSFATKTSAGTSCCVCAA